MSAAAELSVILPTDGLDTVREVLSHLGAQPERDGLEIVLVTPAPDRIARDDPVLEGFAGAQVVEGSLDSLPAARARGVRAATGPIVFLGETHCFPEAGWAAALIEAHLGPVSAVGPVIANANRRGDWIGWAGLFMAYGPWVERRSGGPVDGLPGHNTSFTRSVLLDYGADLERMLESETVMIDDLRARGHELRLEPSARMAHLNVSKPLPFLQERFVNDRNYAAARSAGWPRWRTLLYALATPLVPAVRLRRIVAQIRRAGLGPELLPRVVPALVGGLVVSAIGELVGYTLGPGGTDALHRMEIDRASYVRQPVTAA